MCSGVGLAHEAVYRIVYDVVVITMTRVPYVLAIMAAVVLSYLAYRRRPRPPKWGMWPGIFALLALYGFLAALAPAGWDEPLVLLGICLARSRQKEAFGGCQRNLCLTSPRPPWSLTHG